MVITKALATIEPVEDQDESPNGVFDIILSAQTLDRDGEVLATDGWKTPLPDHIVMDVDHGMSVATTVGSGTPFINDDGDLQVRGSFASTPLGQETRTLVREGHIRTVSVSFLRDKSVKDGRPNRELLNGAFVAIPSNRESVVLSSKALNAIEAEPEVKGPAAEPVAKDAGTAETNLLQAIHDAACLLGAECMESETEPDADDGASDGANKSAGTVTVTVKPQLDMDAFRAQIDALTKTSDPTEGTGSPQGEESAPAESPADAAEKAAPQGPAGPPADAADKATAEESDDVAEKAASRILADLLIAGTRLTALDF